MMLLDNAFEIGQTVYLRVDGEQLAWIVTGINVRHGAHHYVLSRPGQDALHYAFEMTAERDVLKAAGVEGE
jgi:hypothetical protein